MEPKIKTIYKELMDECPIKAVPVLTKKYNMEINSIT